MSDDQDGCEWVSVSSGTGLPGPKGVKRLCVCACVLVNSNCKTNRQLTAVTETEGRGLMLKNDEKNRRTESRNKQDRIKTKLSLMRRVD